MNIHGLKLKLERARDMLKNIDEELTKELKKSRRWRNSDLINFLRKRIKNVNEGMSNLRNKIKQLKIERRKRKKKK